MKKVSSFLLVAVLVFALASVAFAAPSPAPTPAPAPAPVVQPTVTGVAVASGSGIAVAEWSGDGGAVLSSHISSIGGQLLTIFDLKGTGPVTLTVPGVLAGQRYVILHYTGTGVETIQPTAVGNGSISFSVKSNSPFAIVAVPGSGVRSPRTSAC